MAILPMQLARVSNLLRANVSQQQISRTQASLLQVQNELSTGKRLNAPSDDPGDAAIAQQLRKTLEERLAYADNLTAGVNHLSEVDSTLGDVTDLIRQAQTIASANVGSDVTPDQRTAASAIVQNLYSQLMTLGNRQFEGVYLFGGDRSTEAPFVETLGGVKFVGSSTVLQNQFDENTVMPFMVDGNAVFNALSTRIQGAGNLAPSLGAATRLDDVAGATGEGVRRGSILLGNGTSTAVVDLSRADTVQDVISAINNAGLGNISASLAADGTSIQLTTSGADNITINEVGGGTTAADLGILQKTGAGAGAAVDGASVGPRLTLLTPISSLRGGAGLDTTGLTITNGATSSTIDLSAAATVEDVLNAINGSKVGVRAQINAAGTGIDLLNPVQGVTMTVAENGGATATQLGLRSFGPASPLSELNQGKGVRTISGADIQITRRNGSTFSVDLSNLSTVQDVIDAINSADAGGGVTASFAATGNGIALTDSTGGTGTLSVSAVNYSNAMADLGLDVAAAGNTLTGRDVNAVAAQGMFANISKLRDALKASDPQAITAAAEGLADDLQRVTRIRGETGARVQDMEQRQQRLEDQNVATKALLSQLEDTNYPEAVSKFETLQQMLQANYATTARLMNQSLLDFLG